MACTKPHSRYKGYLKPIPASHEPCEADISFEGRLGLQRVTFRCASHFKKVQAHDQYGLMGVFTKGREGWSFAVEYPRTFTDVDKAAMIKVVFDHFDEGWVSPYC